MRGIMPRSQRAFISVSELCYNFMKAVYYSRLHTRSVGKHIFTRALAHSTVLDYIQLLCRYKLGQCLSEKIILFRRIALRRVHAFTDLIDCFVLKKKSMVYQNESAIYETVKKTVYKQLKNIYCSSCSLLFHSGYLLLKGVKRTPRASRWCHE